MPKFENLINKSIWSWTPVRKTTLLDIIGLQLFLSSSPFSHTTFLFMWTSNEFLMTLNQGGGGIHSWCFQLFNLAVKNPTNICWVWIQFWIKLFQLVVFHALKLITRCRSTAYWKYLHTSIISSFHFVFTEAVSFYGVIFRDFMHDNFMHVILHYLNIKLKALFKIGSFYIVFNIVK